MEASIPNPEGLEGCTGLTANTDTGYNPHKVDEDSTTPGKFHHKLFAPKH